jgi:preprotein translocase subunit SecG
MGATLNLLAEFSDTQLIIYRICSFGSIILMFFAALTAIILVLFQQSNSDGIQGITASSETFFGKNKGQSLENKLKKWTWICLIVLAVLAIVNYVVQLLV